MPERRKTDAGHAGRNFDGGQATTTIERTIPDACHAGRYLDGS